VARLRNAERAIISAGKLRDYALNPSHPDGRHKARLFEAATGYNRLNYTDLISQIRDGILELDAKPYGTYRGNELFRVDVRVTGPKGTAVIRTGWIYEEGEDAPRLTTAYPI
jgi:hypothetical protein